MTWKYVNIRWPGPWQCAARHTTFLIDATAEKAAACFRAPAAKGGGNITLNRALIPIRTVGQNPANGLRVSVQDLDASGNPDGTEDAYRVIATGSIGTGYRITGILSDDGTDTGAKKTLTAGAEYGIVTAFESWATGDSITLHGTSFDAVSNDMPFGNLFTSSWGHSLYGIPVLIEDTSGNWYLVGASQSPGSSATTFFGNFSTSTTPDEIGMKITSPVQQLVVGVWTRWELDVDTTLYVSGQGVSEFTTAIDDSKTGITTSAESMQLHMFATEKTFLAGYPYYVSIRADTSTNSWAYGSEFLNAASHHAAVMEGWLGSGASYVWVERKSGGSWTERQGRCLTIGLVVRAIDFPRPRSRYLLGI